MKQKVLLLFLCLNCCLAYGQAIKYRKQWPADISDNCFMKGRVFVHAQYGVPNTMKKYWSDKEKFGDYQTQNYGPIQLTLEYAIAKKTSLLLIGQVLQGQASWSRSMNDTNGAQFNQNYGFSYTNIGAGIGLANHIFYNRKMDLYVKAQATYLQIQTDSLRKEGTSYRLDALNSMPQLNYFGGLGFRYFFKKKLALNMEAGLANTHIVLAGITYRFGL
jgi:hypothetical protein